MSPLNPSSAGSPIPKPKKGSSPNARRKREIKKLDQQFQMDLPEDARCAVRLGCVGSLTKHHKVRRRNMATRWAESNVIYLCARHHHELHHYGEPQFFEMYPHAA